MPRTSIALLLAALAACSEPPSRTTTPASCEELRAAYENELAVGTCASDTECVGAPALARAESEGHAHGVHLEGIASAEWDPCTPATHREALAAVEDRAYAWAAAGCGVPLPPHKRCGLARADTRITCVEHHCAASP
jgi:hypothetical protein